MQRTLLTWALLFWPVLTVSAQPDPIRADVPAKQTAHVWYCDPVQGSTPKNASDTTKGDGSAANPWGSFGSVTTAKLINGADLAKGKVHAGDTIRLRTGDHGVVLMTGPEYLNTSAIIVEAEEGSSPIITRLVSGSPIKHWEFRNLIFQNLPKVILYQKIVQVTGDSITFNGCTFRATPDPTLWTDDELLANCPQYGLYLTGTNCAVKDNYFTALMNCMHIDCDGVQVEHNHCEYFINDGITHTSSNATFHNNRITDQKNILGTKLHHDGMQGWCVPGRTNRNVTICDNYVAFSTGKFPNIPPLSKLKDEDVFQGIVTFSGPWENLVVERNVVMASGFHAISCYGCKNSAIRHNTVIDQGPNGAWIGFFDAANGKSVDNIIERNIAPRINAIETTTVRNNFVFVPAHQPWVQKGYTLVKPQETFFKYDRDKAEFDLRILPTSPAAAKEVTTLTRTPAAGAIQN